MSRRREQRLRRLAIINILVVAGVIGAIAYTLHALRPKAYDERTLCPILDVDETPPPHTVIIVDKTDSYSAQQTQLISDAILRAKDRLDLGERITIAALDDAGRYDPRGEISLCNPGRPDQVNPLYTNPRLVQEKYESSFDVPLERALADLVQPRQAPSSPILEALARQAQTEAFARGVPRRRVLLVSDMLQNSDVFSVYGGGAGVLPEDMPTPDDAARALEERFGDTLRGVRLEVRLIPRGRWEDLQRGRLRAYWEELADALGMTIRWRDL